MTRRHNYRPSANAERYPGCVRCGGEQDDPIHVPGVVEMPETKKNPIKAVVQNDAVPAPKSSSVGARDPANRPTREIKFDDERVTRMRGQAARVKGELGRGYRPTDGMIDRAAGLFAQGATLNEVALEIGISTSTAGAWRQKWRDRAGFFASVA